MDERLFEAPCWIIDVLPHRVPDGSEGRYFAVEEFLRAHPQVDEVFERHLRLLLKLNCYYALVVSWLDEDGPEVEGPEPAELARMVRGCICEPDWRRGLCVRIPSQDAAIARRRRPVRRDAIPGAAAEDVRQLAHGEGSWKVRTSIQYVALSQLLGHSSQLLK